MDQSEFDQEVRMEFYRSGVQVTREIGTLALKTLITLNSGAFVVLLTFIGNVAAQSKYLVPLHYVRFSLFSFLAGITFAFICIAYTYVVSQEASPYPQKPKKTDGWYLPIAVIITSLSFLAFVVGVVSIAYGVEVP